MKFKALCLVLPFVAAIAAPTAAQTRPVPAATPSAIRTFDPGRVKTEELNSRLMGRKVPYRVVLPTGYDKKEENKTEGQRSIRREFSRKSFKRSFTIAEQVNADAIEAKYENGILKLFLPKKEQVKETPKQVFVQ